MKIALATAIVIAAGGIALAQHHQRHGHTPYAGQQQRTVKALSDEQLADLRAGRGMGLALSAELNGYPGPMHVLELADQLELTDQRRTQMRELTDRMRGEAIPVGEKLIERERALDQAFAQAQITPASLTNLTARIGETQAELRALHLKYHLLTADLLSTHEKHRYAQLRGYR
jgi:Spy/CpxP family protein refolding chaperone